jgi:hypothetical protein
MRQSLVFNFFSFILINYFSEIFGSRIMDDLIDCKKQSHDTNSFTEHQILDQCKTKRTENFFKCGEGYTLNISNCLPYLIWLGKGDYLVSNCLPYLIMVRQGRLPSIQLSPLSNIVILYHLLLILYY